MLNKIIALSIIFLLFALSCGEKKDEPAQISEEAYQFDSTDLKLDKLEEEINTFSLKYKFKKGDKFSYRFTSISDNQQSLEMDTLITGNIKQTMTYLFDLNVLDVDNGGTADISITIRSIKLDADINGEKININTAVEPDSANKLEFTENYALTGIPFELRVNQKGEVIEFSKVDRLVNKFLELRELQDSASVEDKNMLRNEFIQGMLKPLAIQIFRPLPDGEVSIDSTWSIAQPPMNVMVYKVQGQQLFTISSIEKLDKDRVAVIDATIKSDITGQDKVSEGGVNYAFKKPSTSAEGKIFFNIDRGLILKSRTKTAVSTEVTVEGPTPKGMQKTVRKDRNTSTNLLELL